MKPYYKTFLFSVIAYFINFAVLSSFFLISDYYGIRAAVFSILTVIGYAFLYTLPMAFISGIVFVATNKIKNQEKRSNIVHVSSIICTLLTALFLLFDFGLYRGWGFHINPLVCNLLTTPGGFASMGLRTEHVVPLVLVLLFIVIVFGAIGYGCAKINRERKFYSKIFSLKTTIIALCVVVVSFVSGVFWYGYDAYMRSPEVLASAGAVPFYITVSMKSFFKKIGVSAPVRNEILMSKKAGTGLDYPEKAVVRDGKKMKYNVIWLTCESLRGDMLNNKVMPNAWNMAQNAVRFTNNHSGGNGTRMGVFSMFYGLYGNYWHPVLSARRGPVFFDWLIEDGYKFYCVTSAKFSYPEFDYTVFAKVNTESLISDDNGLTYERDQRNVKRLCDFISKNHDKGPFFSFMFFESSHAPYEFPEENMIEKDYHKSINYASVSAKDGPALKRRYMNSCNHLDSRLAEVFAVVKKYGLEKNTIIVLVGDHGEEFFEKGRLGHNSTFSREQLHTPLVISIPGVQPQVYDKMSSHLDIIPMLAPYFGVTSAPEDYSLGNNLLDGKSTRDYTIVSSWNEIFYVGQKYKIMLPTSSVSAVTNKLYDINDNIVNGKDKFFAENVSTLMKIQMDSQRFNQ